MNKSFRNIFLALLLSASSLNTFADDENGLQADHRLQEDIANLGILGEIDEPLMEKTLEVMGVLQPKSEKNQLPL